MKKYLTTTLLALYIQISFAEDTLKVAKKYSFLLYDTYNRGGSMNIINQNYYGLMKITEASLLSQKSKGVKIGKMVLHYFAIPFTHEAGHRSILVTEGIGSILTPTFNFEGVAMVKGVKDQDLQMLRQNKLPTYLRLHTSGLESDYLISKMINEEIAFIQEDKEVLKEELFFRKLGMVSYHLSAGFPWLNPKIEENPNELENDVVGHDILGFIKNLYSPEKPFKRYSNYEDLGDDEKKFIKRMSIKTLLNICPSIKIKLKNEDNLRLGMGYLLTPFGDMIEENVWLNKGNKKIAIGLHQYQNKHSWSFGGNLGLKEYPINNLIHLSVSYSFWQQPKNFLFNSQNTFWGSGVESMFRYKLSDNKKIPISIDIGITAKTEGFMLGEMYLQKGVWGKFGFSIYK